TASLYEPLCGLDSRSVLIQIGNGEVLILDLETGKPLRSPDDHFDRNMVALALDGGRFSAGRLAGTRPPGVLPVWNPRDVGAVEALSTVGLPFPGLLYGSPTGKYIAGSTNSARDGAPEILRLKSTEPNRLIIDDMKWFRGSVFFTDDESRMLVAEANGKCSWY